MTGWTIVSADGLIWREWDGEFVVRSDITGNTHLLDARAGAVFARLTEHGVVKSAARIAEDLGDASGVADLAPEIEELLARLERIGLVTSIPS